MADPTIGMFQGDFIVESTLREGMKRLRANPQWLDYMLLSLENDPYFKAWGYQKMSLKAMKDWVLKTEFPIFINTGLDPDKFPCINIAQAEDAESDNTLADINPLPVEDVPLDSPAAPAWPTLAGPFNPLAWDPASATLTLPDDVAAGYVFSGMNIVSASGKMYEIQDVVDDSTGDHTAVVLPAGSRDDFSGALLKSGSPATLIQLESMMSRVTYVIGVSVIGASWQLSVLHSVVKNLLLMFRQELLEKRGLDVSFITSSDFSRDQSIDPQQGWTRYVTLAGKARDTWVKNVVQTVQGIVPKFAPIGSNHLPAESLPVSSQSWEGDQDEGWVEKD